MANSKFEYVRQFEREDHLLPNTWIVVRIDGRGFHKLTKYYGFVKPNDIRALNLMNAAAKHVARILPDIVLGFGNSDEYSFVLHKSCTLFERRSAKIASTVVSTFTSAYVLLWPTIFSTPPIEDTYFSSPSDTKNDPNGKLDSPAAMQLDDHTKDAGTMSNERLDLNYLPTFDARCVCYPSDQNLRDYLSWRQADCHINNLYNTTFWALVIKGGKSNTEAENLLKGTVSGDKNEILFSKFGINYNNEKDIYRKGSVLTRNFGLSELTDQGIGTTAIDHVQLIDQQMSKTQREKLKKARQKAEIVIEHVDIIGEEFWRRRPWILSGQPGRPAA